MLFLACRVEKTLDQVINNCLLAAMSSAIWIVWGRFVHRAFSLNPCSSDLLFSMMLARTSICGTKKGADPFHVSWSYNCVSGDETV
jgi:hypothetical protein